MIYIHGGGGLPAPFILAENLMATATMTATASAAGFPPAAAATENTYEAWRALTNTSVLYGTFAAAQAVDTVALIGHNLHTLGGARVYIGWRPDLVAAHTYIGGTIIPTDGGPVVVCLDAPVMARQVIAWVPDTPIVPSGPFAVAVFVAGQRITLPAWVAPDHIRAQDAVTVEGEAAVSRGGQYLGATVQRKGGRMSPQFSPMPASFVDGAAWGAFRARYNSYRPFLFASSPTHHPADVVYGWRGQGAPELRAPLLGGGQDVRVSMEIDFHVA